MKRTRSFLPKTTTPKRQRQTIVRLSRDRLSLALFHIAVQHKRLACLDAILNKTRMAPIGCDPVSWAVIWREVRLLGEFLELAKDQV